MNKTRFHHAAAASLLVSAIALALFAGCGSDATTPQNQPPRILDIVVNPASVVLGGTARVTGLISDPEGDSLSVSWAASGGMFADSTTSSTTWTAPDTPGTYTLTLTLNDGHTTVDRAAQVITGNATLTVVSEPPGVLIDLNGSPTGMTTPHTFDPLAAGFHAVVITDTDFAYDRTSAQIELFHGSSDTLRFRYRQAESAPLNLGRDDFLEIGGVAYLRGGTGLVYAARTAEGTGLFNSAINPPTGSPNGILLLTGVRVEEPVTVSADGSRIVFVSTDGRLLVAAVTDPESDGIINEITDVRALDNSPRYGPALSPLDRIAHTSTPSDEPPAVFISVSTFLDSLMTNQEIATATRGRKPTWSPEDSQLAYEWEGVILHTSVIPGSIIPSDTLTAEGFNTSPAWGPWGNDHIVMLRGEAEASLDRVMLGTVQSDYQVPLREGLTDPRYLAWSPSQVSAVVSHNPGGSGEILLLFNMPVP